MSTGASIADPADLRQALIRLDLRIRELVGAFRDELTEHARDPLRGLYISDADIDGLLASGGSAAHARLGALAKVFDLDPLETEIVLICLAPDIDLRYERLYGYLQDDVTRRRPTVDLVAKLLGDRTPASSANVRALLGPSARLTQNTLLSETAEDTTDRASLLARPLRLEERVVEFLMGSDNLDPRVALIAELVPPPTSPPEEAPSGLANMLMRSNGTDSVGPVLYVQGPAGAGKRGRALAACAAVQRPALIVDLPALLALATETSMSRTLAAVAREALLQDAILCFENFDEVLRDEPNLATSRQVLRRLLSRRRGATLLLGERRWEPGVWLGGVPAARVEVASLGPSARAQLWRAHLNGRVPANEATELAFRYRLVDHDAIQAVAAGAVSRSLLRGSDEVAHEDLHAAARAVAAPPLDGLAYQVEPRYGWEDIVLPADGCAQLQELCARVRHQTRVLHEWAYGRKHARRAGVVALFAGAPGTGKTMAAEIVAGDLGLELYRIDLSAVVSKYIGETEKNLERIFRAADQGDAVLLFDEADALFGKRSEVRDAHDRYSNVETAYLLQRLETYEGLAVLTTNLRGNLDDAFLRRLDCVLEFPLPEEPERLSIWRRSLPREAPVAEDADLEFLARKFKLAGGHIRNIALTAAFLAASDDGPIDMRQLVRATRREYQKLGKLVAESDFEEYYSLLSGDGNE